MSGQPAQPVYVLAQATRPEQEHPEPTGEFTDLSEAIEAAREIVRVAGLKRDKKGPNYAEVRWRHRLCYCTWVKPEVVISVAHLLDDH